MRDVPSAETSALGADCNAGAAFRLLSTPPSAFWIPWPLHLSCWTDIDPRTWEHHTPPPESRFCRLPQFGKFSRGSFGEAVRPRIPGSNAAKVRRRSTPVHRLYGQGSAAALDVPADYLVYVSQTSVYQTLAWMELAHYWSTRACS